MLWCGGATLINQFSFALTITNILKNLWYQIHLNSRFRLSVVSMAKKDVLHKLVNEEGYDLNIFGVRKSEGGIRSTSYKTCFNEGDVCDSYRPLFWYVNDDKLTYEKHYGVKHSRCYTEYGLKRTGCAGCPFGRDFEFELDVIEEFEPKLFKAVMNIFGDSYEYTRAYRKFCEEKEEK